MATTIQVETFTLDEPYAAVHARMLALVDARIADDIDDMLLLGEHPPTITCGRKTDPANILNPQNIPVVPIERGGDVTYHGPGQLVVYPIIKLIDERRDLHAYLRCLEDAIIQMLAEFNVEGFRHNLPDKNTTGVWVAGNAGKAQKVASIGVAVKRWVTYHGLALNVTTDLSAFQTIAPCGFGADTMTSVQDCLTAPADSLMSECVCLLQAKLRL